jgi:hypothetical protein
MTFEQLLAITNRLSDIVFGRASQREMTRSIAGFGIAARGYESNPNQELYLQFYAQRKQPLEEILPASLVGSLLAGVPTDVVQVGRFVALASTVVTPGFGLAYEKTGASSFSQGTLGAVLVDSQGTRYALSANHVLSRNGDFFQDPGSIIETGAPGPGTAPVEVTKNETDVLFSELVAQPGFNEVDCAMAQPEPSITLEQFWPAQLHNATNNVVDAVNGRTVGKFGNESKWTTGTVACNTGTFEMDCGVPLDKVTIRPGIFVKGAGFAKPGDSGSVVFQKNGAVWEPMGLLLAGNEDNLDTRATENYVGLCELKRVIAALEKKLLPVSRHPLTLVKPETPAPPPSPTAPTPTTHPTHKKHPKH